MDIEVFETPYQVNLGKSGHFEFNGFRINKVLFANIRSLSGKIGDVEFDYGIVRDLTKYFLRIGTNVELVNILSRELNGFNYFDIYDSTTNVNNDLKVEDVLGEFDHGIEIPCSYLAQIKSKSKNSLLISSEVISRINQNIPIYQHFEIKNFNFYPIWYINGPQKSNSCELFCHFNILIHLLSKVFVEFKSQILDLAGTDIQKAVARDQTVEKYLSFSKDELITRLNMLEARNSKLAEEKLSLLEEIKQMREESRKREELLIRQNAQSLEQLELVRNENAQTHEQLAVANTKIDNLTDLVSTTTERAINSLDSLSTQLNKSLPNSILTTGTTRELLIIFRCKYLENEMRDKGLLNANELVFDTISCQSRDKSRSLEFHRFNKLTDEIVREYSISNSIDLSKFIQNNATPDQARYYSTQAHVRKLVYNRNYENMLLDRLDRYANAVADVRIEINQSIQNSQANLRIGTRDDLERVAQAIERIEFRQLRQENTIDEIRTHQVQQGNEIHEIREEQARILTALEQLSRFINTSIVIPGRSRRLKLYVNQQGRLFVNIDRKRHYISEDEANQILDLNG